MENTRFKVYVEEKKQDYGLLYLEPLERGYGDTLGNALRRLLLSSIRGAAVTAVRIVGVLHEFSTIKGIREDVIEILMNLKHIPIRTKQDLKPGEYKIITLDSDVLPADFFTRSENPGVITAKDMPWDNNFEFFGDGILCTLEPGAHLLMEIYVEQGVGYLSAERERPAFPPLPVDAMLADAIFSPVRRVNYEIEPARVGQSIDYERLIIEVWTNGAITPDGAVKEAAKIAEGYFKEIADTVDQAPQVQRVIDPAPKPIVIPEPQGPVPVLRGVESEWFSHPIHELELTIRSENCLLRGGMATIGDLVQKSRDDLLKIRNLGKKSLGEIEAKLASLGCALRPSKPGAISDDDIFDDDEDDFESELEMPKTKSGAKEPEEAVITEDVKKAESESESEAEAEPEAQVQGPEAEEKPKAKTKKSKPKAKKSEPELEAEIETESEPEAKTEAAPEKKTKPKAKAKSSKSKKETQ